MTTAFFDDDDPGYGAWLRGHPEGFVANMTRSKTPTYFVVHRASCSSITPGSSRNNDPGAFTARAYRKAASDDLADLVAWGEQQGFSEDGIRPCGRCLKGTELPTGTGRLFPDEVSAADGKHREGAVRQVTVNTYERSTAARSACLKAHGHRCAVCDIDMGWRYGEVGEGFIHVHHLVEISTVGEEYEVDPIKDLRPVCPNCHAMLHRAVPALSIDDLRGRLRRGSGGWDAPRLRDDVADRLFATLRQCEEASELVAERPFADGGTTMLFARLHRAVMNQIEAGPATTSRYGIWAVTCRDHIAEGIEAMARGEHELGRELLVRAANAMTAFATVQAELDPLADP